MLLNGKDKIDFRKIIILLLAMMMVAVFPFDYIYDWFNQNKSETTSLIIGAVWRFLFSAYAIYFCYSMNIKIFKKTKLSQLLALIPAMVVAVNNFPFITFFSGQAQIISPLSKTIAIIIFCISVGFFEELLFRGIVLPMIYQKLKTKKNAIFLTVVSSSAIFGLFHLINLTAGFNAGVLVQVCYSFLIGALCAIVFLKTRNIIFPILVHSVYDIAGKLCEGTYWVFSSVILTAIVGVIVFVIMMFFLKSIKC